LVGLNDPSAIGAAPSAVSGAEVEVRGRKRGRDEAGAGAGLSLNASAASCNKTVFLSEFSGASVEALGRKRRLAGGAGSPSVSGWEPASGLEVDALKAKLL